MNISDYYQPKDYRGVEINEMMDALKETITSEDLDNESTQNLEDTQDYGESEDEEQDIQEIVPPESQGGPDCIIEYLYNKLDIEEDDYEFGKIIDHYFKNGVTFLKVRYFVDTLGKDSIKLVPFSTLNKYIPIELAGYVNNYAVE